MNSKRHGWGKHVNLIIWGASARLIASDTQVQTEIFEMLKLGITIEACKACSDQIGVTSQLVHLGIDVKYMGESLTHYLTSGEKVLTI